MATTLKLARGFIVAHTPFRAPNLEGLFENGSYVVRAILMVNNIPMTCNMAFYDQNNVWAIMDNIARHHVDVDHLSRRGYTRRYNLVVDAIKHSGDIWNDAEED